MKGETGSIEQEIQDKDLTAPRITPGDVLQEIAGEFYFTALQGARMQGLDQMVAAGELHSTTALNPRLGQLTFCVLVLRNGIMVTGESACISPRNFDEAVGRKIARTNAIEKIWQLLGMRLADKLMVSGVDSQATP